MTSSLLPHLSRECWLVANDSPADVLNATNYKGVLSVAANYSLIDILNVISNTQGLPIAQASRDNNILVIFRAKGGRSAGCRRLNS